MINEHPKKWGAPPFDRATLMDSIRERETETLACLCVGEREGEGGHDD